MKPIFTAILSAIVASIVTVVLQKAIGTPTPQPATTTAAPPITPEPHKPRTLGEIAPMYKDLAKNFSGDDQLYEDHRIAWIKFVREAVQPGLSELEAFHVAQAILEYEAPAYNYQTPLFSHWEKEEDQE